MKLRILSILNTLFHCLTQCWHSTDRSASPQINQGVRAQVFAYTEQKKRQLVLGIMTQTWT
uniref:Uncharacterized protein n=1 Tax=Anguilla anguilla TaxID=7936 RepID=A0A0E9SFA4_ANGAN